MHQEIFATEKKRLYHRKYIDDGPSPVSLPSTSKSLSHVLKQRRRINQCLNLALLNELWFDTDSGYKVKITSPDSKPVLHYKIGCL